VSDPEKSEMAGGISPQRHTAARVPRWRRRLQRWWFLHVWERTHPPLPYRINVPWQETWAEDGVPQSPASGAG